MKRRTILVLGASRPHTGGIATVLHFQFSSSLVQFYHMVLFDTRKRTRRRRTIVEGIIAQVMLLTAYVAKLLTLRPDLVHIHAGGNNDIFRKGWDVLLARACRRRVLLHIHGGDFDRFFRPDHSQELERIQRIFQRCSGVVALSDFWRSLYCRIVDDTLIHVVNNCVDAEMFQLLDRSAARRALNLPLNVPVVLHLGSQGKRKGTFDLLRAMPRVLETTPETVLLLVGPEEDIHQGAIAEGQALAEKLGISHAVLFLGARAGQQKLECLGAADLFVLPSYNENFPISILEAMASGLPVVSTNVGGIPEILSDGLPEDIITPGDTITLAERISAYVNDPKLSQESGRRNRATVKRRFNEKVFAQRLADAYEAAWRT